MTALKPEQINHAAPTANIRGWEELLRWLLDHGPVMLTDVRRHPRELLVLNGYATESAGRLHITAEGVALSTQRQNEAMEAQGQRYRISKDW